MNSQRFTFLCTNDDRMILATIAKHYYRSQSDIIRMLIRETYQKISISLDNKKERQNPEINAE